MTSTTKSVRVAAVPPTTAVTSSARVQLDDDAVVEDLTACAPVDRRARDRGRAARVEGEEPAGERVHDGDVARDRGGASGDERPLVGARSRCCAGATPTTSASLRSTVHPAQAGPRASRRRGSARGRGSCRHLRGPDSLRHAPGEPAATHNHRLFSASITSSPALWVSAPAAGATSGARAQLECGLHTRREHAHRSGARTEPDRAVTRLLGVPVQPVRHRRERVARNRSWELRGAIGVAAVVVGTSRARKMFAVTSVPPTTPSARTRSCTRARSGCSIRSSWTPAGRRAPGPCRPPRRFHPGRPPPGPNPLRRRRRA